MEDVPVAADAIDELRTGVIFRSPRTGAVYLANLAAGTCVCAALGGLLGLAIANITAGAVFGALIALVGGSFRRTLADEIVPRRVELMHERVRFELAGGVEMLLESGAVESIDTVLTDASASPTAHWVAIRPVGRAAMRFRTRDAAEATRLVSLMSRALAVSAPPGVVEPATERG
jgi:hypothetical protein